MAYPSYYPDLVPCDFFFFPKLKIHLNELGSVKDIKINAKVQFHAILKEELRRCFDQLKTHWNKCIEYQRVYFE